MKKTERAVIGFCLVAGLAGLAEGRQKFWVESRLFQASREDAVRGPAVVISAAGLQQNLMRMTADPEWTESLANAVLNEVSTVYKYPFVEELAKLDLLWDGAAQALDQTVVLDGQACRVRLSPRFLSPAEVNLRVVIGQGQDKAAAGSLLDIELVTKLDEPVVLGFRANERDYFLLVAIKTTKREAWRLSEGVRGPYREANLLPPPAPVQRVEPDYPASLQAQKVEGKVVLEVSTDKMGKVTEVRVVEPAHPDLDKSAREALKQWRFESALLDGRAVPVTFLVTVEFKAREDPPSEAIAGAS